MKKQLYFLVQYEDRISRLAKALKWKIYHLLFDFALRKRRRWAFLNTLQALNPPTFKSLGLTFLRNDFVHHFFAQQQRDIDSFWQ